MIQERLEMKITTQGFDKAEQVLEQLSHPELDSVIMKQLTEVYNRGQIAGTGTPKDTGELIQSMSIEPVINGEGTVGYTKEYAPHVEYGHRTRGGGYVEGQHFLQRNAEQQEKIFEQDIALLYSKLMR